MDVIRLISRKMHLSFKQDPQFRWKISHIHALDGRIMCPITAQLYSNQYHIVEIIMHGHLGYNLSHITIRTRDRNSGAYSSIFDDIRTQVYTGYTLACIAKIMCHNTFRMIGFARDVIIEEIKRTMAQYEYLIHD